MGEKKSLLLFLIAEYHLQLEEEETTIFVF